jgi:hypothetical protein
MYKKRAKYRFSQNKTAYFEAFLSDFLENFKPNLRYPFCGAFWQSGFFS